MRDVFEAGRYDAAGRLGELEVPRADVTVDTPALPAGGPKGCVRAVIRSGCFP